MQKEYANMSESMGEGEEEEKNTQNRKYEGNYGKYIEKHDMPTKEENQKRFTRRETEDELERGSAIFRDVFKEVSCQKLDEKVAPDQKPSLYSIKSFEELGLSSDLLKGLYAMKFDRPSKIQEKTLPIIFKKERPNIIAQSQSGTGKTAAFVLSMLSCVDLSIKKPQALCLSPSRELARQILDVVLMMGKFSGCTSELLIKDLQRKDETTSQIMVGTPGTVVGLQTRGLLDLSFLKMFVLDEADAMIGAQGMCAQAMRIKNTFPKNVQSLFFSATFNNEITSFAQTIIQNPVVLKVAHEELTVEGIKQFYVDTLNYENRFNVLSSIYGLLTVGQSIVFTRTRSTADQVQQRMIADGHTTLVLHGGLSSQERDFVIDRFRNGHCKVLISTDVISRGIDVLQVSLVINFDIPLTEDKQPDPETYLHRIGRTGRFGRNGIAINIIYNKASRDSLMWIKEYFGCEITCISIDNLEELEKTLSL